MFRAIVAENEFPPFGAFRLDLPAVPDKPAGLAEVHLFTGVNGTGKTRLLSLLAGILGGNAALKKRLPGLEQRVALQVLDEATLSQPQFAPSSDISASGVSGFAPRHGEQRYNSIIQWVKRVPAFAYHGIAYVSDSTISVMAGVSKPEREACLDFFRPEGQSGKLLQAIANLKVQAAMDVMNGSHDQSGNRSTVIVKALESTISQITGAPFGFTVATYPKPSLRVKWGGAPPLPFDLLPDGLRSVIGWLVDAVVMLDTWLQGKENPLETEAVFLLDEIESHLHPAWQRKILPAFQRLFPKAKIFVATHSPFVIASLNVGWIHRLTLGSDGKVKIEEPIPASAGDSYISVVEDIMGLQEWYDPETEQLLTQFRQKRDAAYQGDAQAQAGARDLATTIGKRSMELDYLMGRELSQMDRQLAKAAAK